MVNYCVCGGCTNSSLSGHRVHRFPNKKKDGAIFGAWVRFVQAKRRDFSSASASKNAVVCSVHFKPEDYRPGDIMEVNMGCRSKNQVRLGAGAVPSVHAKPGSAGERRYYSHRSTRNATLRKRKVCWDLGDTASDEGGDASTASASVLADPEQEAFSPLAPQSSVLHFGPQCNLRPSHRSSVFPQPTTPGTGKQSKKRKTVLQTATTKKRLDQQRAQTRVNIGVAFPRWRQLRDSKGLKTDAMVAVFLLDSYEKTAASTALVHELPKPPPVSTNISDRKGQEMKSESFGPWSSVSLKLEQVQEDGDGNDSSSFSVDIIHVKQEDPVHVKQEDPVHVKQEDPVHVKQEDPVHVKQEDPVHVKQEDPVHVKQEDPVHVKQEDPVHVKQEDPVHVKQEDPVHVKQEDPVHVKQEDPVHVKQEDPVHVKQEDPVHVKQEDTVHVKQEDTGESEFWCSASMQQDPEMSGGVDACHPVSLHFNKLKEADHYWGNGESLPSEDHVQTLKSEDLKTEEPIEEQSMDRKDHIKVCSSSISYQATHMQTIMQTFKISSPSTQTASTVSELTKKSQQKLLKGFHRNFLVKNPLCKASRNTTQMIDHMGRFILHMAKGYPPIKTLPFLDNMEWINETGGPIAHLTRHSRKHIRRQLRQKLKDINTLIKSHKRTLKGSGDNPSTPKQHAREQGCASLHVVLEIKMLKVLLIFI